VEQGFKEIWQSDRYWEVMSYLASSHFNAQKMCGALCLQHKANEVLDEFKKVYSEGAGSAAHANAM
jgi:hypothetical protein